MTTISVKIKGLDEVIRNLNNVNVNRKFVDAANQSITEVHRRALVEVPVDTSMLQKSHQLSPATLHKSEAEVYTNKEYAVPVHEGHRIVAWGHDTGRRQPPNPWMERAVRQSLNAIERIFSQTAEEVAKFLTK